MVNHGGHSHGAESRQDTGSTQQPLSLWLDSGDKSGVQQLVDPCGRVHEAEFGAKQWVDHDQQKHDAKSGSSGLILVAMSTRPSLEPDSSLPQMPYTWGQIGN